MGKIKILSNEIINQIAAGEIVERPSSALKEIVENAIDAGSKNIEIFLKNGGKGKIVVEDDGEGLDKDDLAVSTQRHATSKLNGSNLFEINSYGFRGEALPSIASISRFSIESNYFGISVNFSEISEIFPSKISKGTRVTIENLFDTIPARLKFLKSDNVELSNCTHVIENFALNRSDINFTLTTENGTILLFKNDSLEERISKILGKDLFKKAISFQETDGTLYIRGYLYHPIDSRYSQSFQRIFVNGRIVKDNTISSAIKNAYKDLIPTGRFAIALLFIEIDPFYVDINVSPTKSEIRFRDPVYTQKMLTESIKKNLSRFDRVTVDFDFTKTSNLTHLQSFQKTKTDDGITFNSYAAKPQFLTNGSAALSNKIFEIEYANEQIEEPKITEKIIIEDTVSNSFFGDPLCQIFDTYIISKTEDGIIIIDQHAVHEKITQEKIIQNLNLKNKQYLLRPEILELSNDQLDVAKSIADSIKECGFNIELVQNSLIISAIPSVIDKEISIQFIIDILESKEIIEELHPLDFIKKEIADKACYGSIRSGRKLTYEEMKAIIKDMEKTESIHQCNHNRPTFLLISKKELEIMFERR